MSPKSEQVTLDPCIAFHVEVFPPTKQKKQKKCAPFSDVPKFPVQFYESPTFHRFQKIRTFYSHQKSNLTMVFLSNKILSTLALAGVMSMSVTSAFVQRPFSAPRSIMTKSSAPVSALNAVGRKESYSVTLLPGDGIGPEITTATREVLTAVCERFGFKMDLKEALIGGAALDAVNDPFPQESLDQCLASDSVLLACIGGYKWDKNPRELRPESGLLKMRKEMGLFANLRPAKVLPQLIDASTLKPEIVEGVDVMVVRELTGDVYFGTPKGIDIIDGA
jgi:3-isopropylmalate dehydrogenase